MGGSTKKVDTTPTQTIGVRKGLIDYLMGGGGANGGALGGLNRVQSGQGYQPQGVDVQQAGGVDTSFGPSLQLDRGQTRDVGTQFQGGGMAPAAGTNFSSGVDPFNRGQVRDVGGVGFQSRVSDQFNPGMIQSQGTQSVDQLGGAASPFMQQILSQTQPLFDQQRDRALAQAKEQSGNLTGSGYANALGNSMAQLVPQQQAQLAQYASQQIAQEQQRQQQDASRGLQAGQGNQQAGLQAQGMRLGAQQAQDAAAQGNAGLSLQGQLANQGADTSFLQQLLGQGGQNLQAQGMGLQAQGMNQQAFNDAMGRGLQSQQLGLQGQGMNQSADQNFINQLLQLSGQDMQGQQLGLQGQMANQGNQQQGYNLRAQLEAARQGQLGQTDAQRQAQNASIFAQLLGQQGTAGVAPSEIVKSGGIGALLSPLMGGIGGMIGSGGNPLGFLGGMVKHGGGGYNVNDPLQNMFASRG